jgi:hypothetical protein
VDVVAETSDPAPAEFRGSEITASKERVDLRLTEIRSSANPLARKEAAGMWHVCNMPAGGRL